MKAPLPFALMAAALLGCGHAKTTDAQRTSDEKAEQADGPASERRPRETRSGERRDEGSRRAPEAKQSGGDIPVATDASGLLAPGADKQIREKLSEGGFTDGRGKEELSTEEALRRFQREKELPATGMPDDATVRALGLDPGDVFRRATPEGGQRDGVKN